MLQLKEYIDLRNMLAKAEISIDQAKEHCWGSFKEGKRSWHTQDWKNRRSSVIKEYCELCGGNETLTLQHLSHPRKYKDIINEVTRELNSEYLSSEPIIDKSIFINHIRDNYEYEPTPLCPNCKTRHPNKRTRKVPTYLCLECRHEFEKVSYFRIEELVEAFYAGQDSTELRDKCFISKDEWRNQHNLTNIRYWYLRGQTSVNSSEIIERQALLIYLEEQIKYLSFEDTITACRRCAAAHDLQKMEICPSCRKYYKGVKYPTCIPCLPENRRMELQKRQEFNKLMHDLHKSLGID